MEKENSSLSPKGLLSSIFKYSIATWINFVIYGLTLLLTAWFVPAEVWGRLNIFINTTTLVMNICILGLDQSFIRFFNEPPHPLDKKSLFGSCFGISAICLFVALAVCCLVFPQEFLAIFFAVKLENRFVLLLFINAFMAMIGRYINIAYRMAGSIKLYTLESVVMQFFSKMFFLAGLPFGNDFNTLVYFLVGGMAAFGLFFLYAARKEIYLSPKVLFTAGNRQTLPYGLALMPTAVMLWLNSLFSAVYISKTIGEAQSGVFSMVNLLSQVVAIIQAGFATFWSAFIYANYKTQQEKIKQVHDYLTFLIAAFFCVLVAFEDIIFIFLGANYRQGIEVFPLTILVPVFLIISETTVYGISIAKKPIYDTVGIGLSVAGNIGLCYLLAPALGLRGVCLALCISNVIMFVFRTVAAQKFYPSIPSVKRTVLVCTILFALTFFGILWAHSFLLKLVASVAAFVSCLVIYKKQFKNAMAMAKEILQGFKERNIAK